MFGEELFARKTRLNLMNADVFEGQTRCPFRQFGYIEFWSSLRKPGFGDICLNRRGKLVRMDPKSGLGGESAEDPDFQS